MAKPQRRERWHLTWTDAAGKAHDDRYGTAEEAEAAKAEVPSQATDVKITTVVTWRVRWLDESGKRRSETFASQSAAAAALRRQLVRVDDIRAGVVRPKADQLLSDIFAAWISTRPPDRKRDDESRWRAHIEPYFGKHRPTEITADQLQRFIRHLEQKKTARPGQKEGTPLRPMTIKNTLNLLCKLLGDSGFPTRVKFKVPEQGYAWIQKPEDVGRFLDACTPPWFKVAAALAVHTGLRKGEIAGLLKSAIDWDQSMIRIDRTYEGKPTKTKAQRWVPLSPELAAILKPWVLKQPGPLVVTRPPTEEHPDGFPIDRVTDCEGLTQRACDAATLDRLTFHGLRHTAASHAALVRPIGIVGALLGHSDVRTTQRYAHLDTASLARDTGLHLSFTAPAGKVVPLKKKRGPRVDHKRVKR